MVYVPPVGWAEEFRVDDGMSPGQGRIVTRFHARIDCPRIHDARGLRRVDKPYSAVRCTLCADEMASVAAVRVLSPAPRNELA